MEKKPISSLAAGDVVARPVIDDKGNVLVHEDAEITDALIRVLIRRGIEEVEIKDQADEMVDASESVDEAMRLNDPVVKQKLTEMRERLNLTFHRHEGNVTMAMLYKSALDYLTVKILRSMELSR